jgi:hypothetical protein
MHDVNADVFLLHSNWIPIPGRNLVLLLIGTSAPRNYSSSILVVVCRTEFLRLGCSQGSIDSPLVVLRP